MLKVVSPHTHNLLVRSHAAGRLYKGAPGPYTGRSIIHKLQTRIHMDGNDMPYSAMTTYGHFCDGQMILPQLDAKLAYGQISGILFLH